MVLKSGGGRKSPLGILGAGGQALELAEYCVRRIAFHAVDREYLEPGKANVAIEDPDAQALQTEVVIAMGAPGAKRDVYYRWPGTLFATVIADSAYLSSSTEIGTGSILAPLATVMASARIGEHVTIGVGSIVSHECVIGNFTTLSPGVKIGGRVALGAGVFVGIGATIRDGVSIGDGAVIGAGAVIIEDVGPLEVVVGVPGRRLRVMDDWLQKI